MNEVSFSPPLKPVNPLGLQSRFGDDWGHITWNLNALSPTWDWSSKGVCYVVLCVSCELLVATDGCQVEVLILLIRRRCRIKLIDAGPFMLRCLEGVFDNTDMPVCFIRLFRLARVHDNGPVLR